MKQGQISVGHPVDVGSGNVFTEAYDFVFPGAIPLKWRRFYSTGSSLDSWLGKNWSVPYFSTLRKTPEAIIFNDLEGNEIEFSVHNSDLEESLSIINFSSNMELKKEGDYFCIIHWHYTNDEPIEKYFFKNSTETILPLNRVENVVGHKLIIKYDLKKRPTEIFQSLEERKIVISYNKNNLIKAIYRTHANTKKMIVQYVYNQNNQLAAAIDSMGNKTTYEYNNGNYLILEKNPLGAKFKFKYDQMGRCVYSTGNDKNTEITMEYRIGPKMTSVIDGFGNRTNYILNNIGQVIQEISPKGNITTMEYDSWGRIIKTIYPDGGVEEFGYDDKGNRNIISDSTGFKVRLSYNDSHLLTDFFDSHNSRWKFHYDNSQNRIKMINPLGGVTQYFYNKFNLLRQLITPAGRSTTWKYGKAIRFIEKYDQTSLIERIEYDLDGNPIAEYDSIGLANSAKYDALNRVVETQGPNGSVKYRYNSIGELIYKNGPGSNKEVWDYDIFGRIISHNNLLNSKMHFVYDSLNRLTSVTNRKGENLSIKYDEEGNISEEKYFNDSWQKFSCNFLGQPVKVIKSNGTTIEYEYDRAGRLIKLSGSDGYFEKYDYDKNGNLIAAENEYSTIKFEFDKLYRRIAEVQNDIRIEFGYDDDGLKISRNIINFDNSALKILLDKRGRPTELIQHEKPCLRFKWDNLNRLVRREFHDKINDVRTYDKNRRLCKQVVSKYSYLPKISHKYSYDKNGNTTQVVHTKDSTIEEKITYDKINRVVSVDRDNHLNYYKYDTIGTILETQDGRRQVTGGGKTVSDGKRSFTYDESGNVKIIKNDQKEASLLEYNTVGQMTSFSKSDGTKYLYKYDPLGRRISKSANGNKSRFVWDGSNLAAEIVDGNVEWMNFSIDYIPQVIWTNKSDYLAIEDRSGFICDIIDENGDHSWSCTRDIFGKIINEGGNFFNPFRFRGQYHDVETNLYYNFFRYYDPELCDYLTPDPIGIEGGVNFYGYPRNPLRFDDPFGLSCNRHRGRHGESRMDKLYRRQGYRRIGKDPGPNGIDGVYRATNPNRRPQYIIADAKYNTSRLRRTADGNMQMSDGWIDARINHRGQDRLTRAVGRHEADRIRTAALDDGQVERQVVHAPIGGGTNARTLGNYDPWSGNTEAE